MPYIINPFTGEFDFYTNGVPPPGTISHHDLLDNNDGDDHLMYFLLAGRVGNNQAIISGDANANGQLMGSSQFPADLSLFGCPSPIGGGAGPQINTVNIGGIVNQVTNQWSECRIGAISDVHMDASGGLIIAEDLMTRGVWNIDDDTGSLYLNSIRSLHYVKNNPGFSLLGGTSFRGFQMAGGAVADNGVFHLSELTGFDAGTSLAAVNGGVLNIDELNGFRVANFAGADINIGNFAGFKVQAFLDNVSGSAVGFDVVGLGVVTGEPISFRSQAFGATMRHIGDVVIGNLVVPAAGLDLFPDLRLFPTGFDSTTPDNNPIQRSVIFEALTAGAPWHLTGLVRDDAGPHVGGRYIIIYNKSSQPMTLKHEDAGSDPLNRFQLPGSVDLDISSDGAVTLFYTDQTKRWVVVSADTRTPSFDSATFGSAHITGKLTVDGVIDPTMVLLSGGDKRFGATDAGPVYLAPFVDAANAIQVRKADNTTLVFNLDTTNGDATFYGANLFFAGGAQRADITGCDQTGFGMGLSPVVGSTMDNGDTIFLAPNVTTLRNLAELFRFPVGPSTALTVDVDTTPAAFEFLGMQGQWTISSANNPFVGFSVENIRPTFQNPTGVAVSLAQTVAPWYFAPNFLANDAACTLGDTEFHAYTSEITFTTVGSGTITTPTPLIGFEHSVLGLSGAAGSVVYDNIGFKHEVPSDSQLAPNSDTAFYVAGSGIVPTGINASLRSEWGLKVLRHAGPGVFGADSDPTNASIGLELLSTTKAFIPSRLTTTERNALTPVNGMIIYNSTTDKFQGYEAGAWTNLI
jgi:hypothetical protein